MDILYVASLFRPADFGGGRYAFEVTRRLASGGHTVRVMTPRPGGPLPEPTHARLIHYPVSRRTPFETFFTNAYLSQLAVAREARRQPPDVIVFSTYDVAFGHLSLRPVPRTPTVFVYHSSFYSDAVDRVARKAWPLRLAHAPLRAFLRSVEGLTLRRATALFAVSPFSLREIEARLGRPHPRLRLVPTGVDVDFFRPGDRDQARDNLGVPRGAPFFVTVGRLVPVKRYDRALETLALVRRDDPRALLALVGDGPEAERLRQQAGRLGLDGAVRMPGFLDGGALRDHYVAADLVLCTSDFENWSMTLLEAFACGTPAIGTPRGSIPDLIGLVDPSLVAADVTPNALATSVRAALADRVHLRALGDRAHREIAARYGWSAVVERLESELAVVVDMRRSRGR